MVVLAVRLPLVIVIASPVIVDLLTGPCYLDSKSHSLLMNCGTELFSLEDFFASAYACNGHFWRMIAIAGNFLQPGFAQTFLNGIAAVGENSGMSAFMPGIIGAMSKVSENDPMEGVTKTQDLVSGGGARFGPATMFMKMSVNPIAGAHWMWRIGSGVIVNIIQAVKAKRSIGSVFWNIIYDGRVDYKELVASRMFNTCGGFALMAGYTTPLGNMILHYCFAGVKSTMATLDLISVFLVDMPVIVCVCKQTSGNNPADWIINNCDAPDGFKPLLRRIMDSPAQCADLVAKTNANLTGVFDDVFGELFAGTTSTGSILDSFLSAVDPNNAGQCDNFDSNPYVITIIPEPADYWRVCGSTDFCKLRCQQQMEAFASVQPPTSSLRSSTSEQTVQSLFFPSLNADAYNPYSSVVAITEMEKCTEPEDRCFLLAGFVGSKLQISEFDVPSALSRGVSKSTSWDTYGISGLSTYIQFIRTTAGPWHQTYCVVGMQDQLVQVCAALTCFEFVPTDLDLGVLGFQRMQSMNDNKVLFQVRTISDGMQTYCLSFQNSVWIFEQCSTNIWSNEMYHMVATAQGEILLLPFDDVPLQLCGIAGSMLTGCTQYDGFQRQNVPVKTKVLQSRVAQYISKDYNIFIASNDPSHWLTMLSVSIEGSYASAAVGNSMPVSMEYTIAQSCSLDSCIGCTQLAVQRLCFAAQRCQVARCIGSQVNQLRPLCAVGGAMESGLFSILALAQGIWSMVSSTLVTILDASGGISPPTTISWPDQVFYGMVCSTKDVIASQVSIITSMINGIMQSSMSVQPMAMADTLDNNFLATFTLTMTAVTKFLYQLSLGPLYAAIAVQKVLVCQTNSLVAVVSGNNKVTIGDPSIQTASSSAAGMCMTQVMGENAQGLNSGMDNNKAFTSGSTQVLSQIGGLALQLPLDAIRHPIDATFTYVLGVVRGLQDILQTADQRK